MTGRSTPEERLAEAVRAHTELGRILPLGVLGHTGSALGEENGRSVPEPFGVWIVESAAAAVLRRAAEAIAEVRMRTLRIGPAREPGGWPAGHSRLMAPISALPPGPLRVQASFDAAADRPLPQVARQVRTVLAHAATDDVGLGVTSVDLEISGLLDPGRPSADVKEAGTPPRPAAVPEGEGTTAVMARAALAVPGVARLDAATLATLTGPRTRLTNGYAEIGVALLPGRRAVDVALAVRDATTEAAGMAPGVQGPLTVAVLVTSTQG